MGHTMNVVALDAIMMYMVMTRRPQDATAWHQDAPGIGIFIRVASGRTRRTHQAQDIIFADVVMIG